MIIVFVFGVMGAILGFKAVDPWDFGEWITAVLLAIAGTILGWIIGFGLATVLGSAFGTNIPDVSRSYLANIADSTQIDGDFFLASGTVDEHQTFSYYKQVADSEYQISSIRADAPDFTVTVKEVDVDRPYIETTGKRHDPMISWWWARHSDYTLERATFYIPKGTIIRNYSLDAK